MGLKRSFCLVALVVVMCLLAKVAGHAASPSDDKARPLKIRQLSLYHGNADGTGKWPATTLCPTFESYVDRAAEAGFNEITLSAVMFPPMQVIDLAAIGYPEAVEFSKEQVERQRAILDRNAAYAASKGIRLLPSGYEHLVPAKFYFAHQEELNPGGKFTAKISSHEGLSEEYIQKEHVVGNISWNRPAYRRFWEDSYREYFRVLPNVTGLHQTYGEWAWAYEEKSHAENLRDYLTTCWKILREARGDKAVLELRDWYVKSQDLADPACPKVCVIAKDCGHDAASPELGPWIMDYIKAGIPAVGELNLTGAENTRPVLWFDPGFIQARVENLVKAGAAGYRARVGQPGHFVTDLEFKAIKALTIDGKPFTAEDAVAALRPRFGEAAPEVFRALQRSGAVLLEYTKLHSGRLPWWQSDGVSINVLHTGFRYFEGFRDPLDFLRRDAVGVVDYALSLTTATARRSAMEAQWKQSGLLTPPVIVERIRGWGVEAKESALKALNAAPASAVSDPQQPLQELAASACMVYHTSRVFGSFVELAIDYWQMRDGSKDEMVRQHLLKKMDECAIEWTIIGRIGDQWFPSRMTSEIAEQYWRKYAKTLEKHLKIKYPGLEAGKVVLDPEIPNPKHPSFAGPAEEKKNNAEP